MVTVQHIAEAVLYTDDLEATANFYQRVLRLPVTAAFGDACFLQTGPDSTLILFDRQKLRERESVIPGHGSQGPGHVAFAALSEEMDAWRERLVEHDVEIEHEQRWPQGSFSIYFRDPAGNSVELIESSHYPKIWEQMGGAKTES